MHEGTVPITNPRPANPTPSEDHEREEQRERLRALTPADEPVLREAPIRSEAPGDECFGQVSSTERSESRRDRRWVSL